MARATIAIFILLIFAFTMKEARSSSLKTLLNALTTDNGEVPIHRDQEGIYVEVDFDYKASPSPDVNKMLLSLTNSETMLAINCDVFDKYYCSAHHCNPTGNNITFSYPLLYVEAKVANVDLFLDYSSWSLKANAYLATYCRQDYLGGFQRVGVLGLGTAGRASESFIGSKIFSIYLNQDTSGSKLLFRFDKSLTTSDEKIVLHTDENWRTSFATGGASIKLGDNTYYLPSGKVIFYPDFRYIAFPWKIYRIIDDAFTEYGISCGGTRNLDRCKGNIYNLPKFYLKVGAASIEIPPKVYGGWLLPNDERGMAIYNLNGFLSDDYDDAIILGSSFMNYYYTVFDATQNQNTISLYVKGSRGPLNSLDPIFLILLIVLLVILVSAAIIFAIQKKKKRQAQLNPSTEGSLMNS